MERSASALPGPAPRWLLRALTLGALVLLCWLLGMTSAQADGGGGTEQRSEGEGSSLGRSLATLPDAAGETRGARDRAPARPIREGVRKSVERTVARTTDAVGDLRGTATDATRTARTAVVKTVDAVLGAAQETAPSRPVGGADAADPRESSSRQGDARQGPLPMHVLRMPDTRGDAAALVAVGPSVGGEPLATAGPTSADGADDDASGPSPSQDRGPGAPTGCTGVASPVSSGGSGVVGLGSALAFPPAPATVAVARATATTPGPDPASAPGCSPD